MLILIISYIRMKILRVTLILRVKYTGKLVNVHINLIL